MRSWMVVLLLGCACSKQQAEEEKRAAAESVRVQLPKARASGDVVAAVQVHLEAGGAVWLDGAQVKADELSSKLRAMRAETPSLEVHLDAAPDMPYAKVIEALDAAHQAGIMDISFDAPPKQPVEAPSKQP
ncbi:MAG: biopolymer transporter ExbD [Myxococcaceae bacterium]